MVRALNTGVKDPEFKTQLVHGIFQNLSRFTQQYMTVFRAGEGERR